MSLRLPRPAPTSATWIATAVSPLLAPRFLVDVAIAASAPPADVRTAVAQFFAAYELVLPFALLPVVLLLAGAGPRRPAFAAALGFLAVQAVVLALGTATLLAYGSAETRALFPPFAVAGGGGGGGPAARPPPGGGARPPPGDLAPRDPPAPPAGAPRGRGMVDPPPREQARRPPPAVVGLPAVPRGPRVRRRVHRGPALRLHPVRHDQLGRQPCRPRPARGLAHARGSVARMLGLRLPPGPEGGSPGPVEPPAPRDPGPPPGGAPPHGGAGPSPQPRAPAPRRRPGALRPGRGPA